MRLLIYEPTAARMVDALRDIAGGLEVVVLAPDGGLTVDGEPVDDDDASPEVGFASTDLLADGPIREFMVTMLKSPSARYLQSAAAGFDHPVFAMLAQKGIVLCNSDATSVAVSEFVMARVLEVLHPTEARRRAQADKRWERLTFREVAGTRWLVVGLGSIGRRVAALAQAFGAHVTGVRRRARGDAPVDEVVAPSDVSGVLGRSDVVVLAVPLNDETVGMVDEAFLAAMAPGSILVNVARGPIVDEGALVDALDRGVPDVAILDVFHDEPLPVGSPLWKHPRARVTAHCAPASAGTMARADAAFVDNLRRYVRGEPLEHVVDPESLAG